MISSGYAGSCGRTSFTALVVNMSTCSSLQRGCSSELVKIRHHLQRVLQPAVFQFYSQEREQVPERKTVLNFMPFPAQRPHFGGALFADSCWRSLQLF